MVKIYETLDDEGDIAFAFATRSAAEAHAGPNATIIERIVYEDSPPTWTYWHRGASVFPDGVVEDWTQEHTAKGEVTMPRVDDHLNRRDEPWDGHTQGHCGEHVSVFGTDKDAVEVAYQAAVAVALSRQTGACQSPYAKHDGDIDGANVYESGFLRVRKRGERESLAMDCYPHFSHDWQQERPGLSFCRRCSCALYQFSATVESPQAVDAVDPQASSTGTPSTRDEKS